MLSKSIAIAIGGAVGALLRFGIQNWAMGRWGLHFPYGTLLVNVTGAFLMGLAMTLFLRHVHVSPVWRLMVVTGILGGYTTFSALAWETFSLYDQGQMALAMAYIGASVIGGGLSLGAGVWCARFF